MNASNMFGDTALHWAASRGHAAVVKFLVNGGADMMAVDSNRSDPRVETRVVREKKAGLVAYKGLRCDSEWILPLVCHA